MLAVSAASLGPPASLGHVVYGRRTLSDWTAGSRVIAVARIASPLQVWSAPDGSDHQEYFSVEVVEPLAGTLPSTSLDVFPHAEGEPRLRVGATMILFLDPTAERAEFAHLAGRFPYFTAQGAGQEWIFDSIRREIPDAVLAWRRVQRNGGAYAERRDLVLAQLESPEPLLRADAIFELTRLRSAPEMAADENLQKRLALLVASQRIEIPRRLALIKILEGLPGYDASTALLDLAGGDLTSADRIAVIRSCRGSDDSRVLAWLAAQLDSPEAPVRAAALTALASPQGAPLADRIARAAADPDQRVARAAVASLATIATPAALARLESIAASDAPVAPQAAARLRRVRRGQNDRSASPK